MAEIIREIEAWYDLQNSTENEDVKMAATQYMEMLRDEIVYVTQSRLTRKQIEWTLQGKLITLTPNHG